MPEVIPATPEQSYKFGKSSAYSDPKAIQYLKDLYGEFDRERKEREQAWNKWTAMFRGVFWDHNHGKNNDGVHNSTAEEKTTKSKLYINETKKSIVSAVSNVMSILFQRVPNYLVTGVGSDLDDDIAKQIQEVVWYFLMMSRYPVLARRYLTQCAVYGVTYAKIYMEQVQHTTFDYTPILSEVDGTQIGSRRTENFESYPMVRWAPVDLFDMWPDPCVPDHTKWGRGTFHRLFRTEQYVKNQIDTKKWRNVNLSALKNSVDSMHGRDQRRTIVGLNPLKRNEVELMEFTGLMPRAEAEELKIEVGSQEYMVPVVCMLTVDKEGVKDYLFAKRNDIPSHEIPFIRDIWEDTGEGYAGRGIPENSQGPQMALNATVNSRIDNKATAIQQIIGVVEEALTNPEEDLSFKQNWIMRFENEGDIRTKLMALNVADVTQGAHIEANEFARHIEEGSGILKYVQGTESYGSNRTASGIQTVYSAASKFIRDIAQQHEHNLISGTARLIYKHVLKYMPDEFLVLLTEDPNTPIYRQIALRNLAKDVDFIPYGVQGLAQRELAQSQMIQYAQITANPVDLQIMGLQGRRALHQEILDQFGWKERVVKKILPDQPQLPLPPPAGEGAEGAPPGSEGPSDLGDLLGNVG